MFINMMWIKLMMDTSYKKQSPRLKFEPCWGLDQAKRPNIPEFYGDISDWNLNFHSSVCYSLFPKFPPGEGLEECH